MMNVAQYFSWGNYFFVMQLEPSQCQHCKCYDTWHLLCDEYTVYTQIKLCFSEKCTCSDVKVKFGAHPKAITLALEPMAGNNSWPQTQGQFETSVATVYFPWV